MGCFFCNMVCYDKYHEENYVKVFHSKFTGNNWYWDFKHQSIHIGNFK